MEAIIFVGIQGSGKSSFFKERFASSHIHINLDRLKTRRRERAALEECFRERKSFVADNTNPSAEDRRRYVKPAKAKGLRVVCYYFDLPVQEAVERNSKRTGKAKVPPVAIIGTNRRLEAPTFAEGFDDIYRVTVDAAGSFAVVKLQPPAGHAPSS